MGRVIIGMQRQTGIGPDALKSSRSTLPAHVEAVLGAVESVCARGARRPPTGEPAYIAPISRMEANPPPSPITT